MSEFNLLDEAWISVVTDYKGSTKLVGMKEFFKDAHKYIALAGDTKTQDFAVMRFLLAVLHTVFSRYDADGNPYEMVELNERMQQVEEVYEEDESDYKDALMDTWKDLWNKGKFPEIVDEYLEAWRDRFYLFDDKYPFYQVTKDDINPQKISKSAPSEVMGKNINRLISESANKIAIFSPKYSSDNNKEKLSYEQTVRWLITYQSYTGLSDKVIFGKDKYKASKGWLFDIGGVFLSSNNLFKTLLLNLKLVNYSNTEYNTTIEKPCWEFDTKETVSSYLSNNFVDNISQLYTAWSRAININKFTEGEPFSMQIVKLPEIKHENNFLEPMTIWRYNLSGENKEKFTPRKHQVNKAVWRSFGLITKTEGEKNNSLRKPGIIDWLKRIENNVNDKFIRINAISMEDDGNATSWVPTNEIYDYLNIEESIINDLREGGWVERINMAVDETKEAVEVIYKQFINDIKNIRNLESNDFVNNNVEIVYYEIDKTFRDWIFNLSYNDSKDEKIINWYDKLKVILFKQAEKMYQSSSPRDITGVIEDNSIKNIFTVYNIFVMRINKKFSKKEVKNEKFK